MTGELAASEATAVAIPAGEQADRLRERFAVAASRGNSLAMAGEVVDVTPAQAMAQISESLTRAVGRMDDVSLEMESTSVGTRFSFRAYNHRR